MATISSGSVTVTIQPGEQYRVIATGEAYVDIGGGSTQSYRLVNGASERLLGGFIVATPVTIRVISGSVDYINVSGTGDSVALSLAQSSRTDINGLVASTASGGLLLPNGKIKGIKEYLKFCYPCNQTGTSQNLPLDYSGNGVAATYGVNLSTPWSSAGYLTTPGGSNQHIVIAPRDDFYPNMFTDSWSIAFVVNKAAPASDEGFLGNGSSSTNRGFYLIAKSTGKLQININTENGATGLQAAIAASTATVFDGADHHVRITADAPNKTMYLYIDGALDSTGTYTITANTYPVNDLTIGRAGAAGNAVAVKVYGFTGFIFQDSNMPINDLDLTRLVYQSRRAPALSADIEAFF